MTRIVSLIKQSPAVADTAAARHVEDPWPGLDAVELARSGGDPEQVAGLIAQQALVSIDDSGGTLVRPDEGEPPFYFG
jgi:hypothetical protein